MPLDPTIAQKLHLVEDIASWDEAFADSEKSARLFQFLEEPSSYSPPQVSARDETIGSDGVEMRVRIYEPTSDVRGVFVWVHGGGFTGGTIDMPEGDFFAREVCQRASVIVVAVDYTVASPGYGYPHLHRQVAQAFTWARSTAPTWGTRAEDVVLGGGSAGANLVLGAVAEALDTGADVPPLLLLAYPTAHRALPVSPDVEKVTASLPPLFRFTPESVTAMYEAYAAGAVDTPYLSMDGRPLTGFPPMRVIVDEYDDLRTSGEALVADAKAAGVDATIRLAPQMLHGHFNRNASVPQVDADLTWVAQTIVPDSTNRSSK